MPWIITVTEPFTIGVPKGKTGTGGWTIPPVMTPVHTAMHATCAAGSISIITGPVIPGGHGPEAGILTAPQGTSMSCVNGSPFLAAGNILHLLLHFHCP